MSLDELDDLTISEGMAPTIAALALICHVRALSLGHDREACRRWRKVQARLGRAWQAADAFDL